MSARISSINRLTVTSVKSSHLLRCLGDLGCAFQGLKRIGAGELSQNHWGEPSESSYRAQSEVIAAAKPGAKHALVLRAHVQAPASSGQRPAEVHSPGPASTGLMGPFPKKTTGLASDGRVNSRSGPSRH
ncbi:hypothetical protein CHARACLAT_026796 [Characodon lateralis]|uniref:Uncharacterized protein n=1 Tax=Characodon lateralis TaxID=208331 RepID=A0ABU7DAA3_9TELE|nr:hypothetical protein [Characodon lateralis]